MKGLELKIILNKIKVQERHSITEIAKNAGIDRGTLSTATNMDAAEDVTENMIFKLQQAYPAYFSRETTKPTEQKPIHPNLKPKDLSNFILVPFVPIRARASYLASYGDPIFVENMETVAVIVGDSPRGEYRAFEVAGDSMENPGERVSYYEHDVILCRKIGRQHWTNKLHMSKWDFVIVHREEGIVIKRITDHNLETGEIVCHSLNPLYSDFTVFLDDVLELYNVVKLVERVMRS